MRGSGGPAGLRRSGFRSLWLSALLTPLLLTLGLLMVPVAASAAPGDVGVEGPSHTGTNSPTGTKRSTSALWFNDGSWWGNLWDTASSDFHIFRFNAATSSWVDTGVTTETRSSTHHDVLWDGTTLYVASYRFLSADPSPAEPGFPTTMRRYSYNTSTKTYTLLGSSQIHNYRVEALTIDKDSTGRVWATWQQGNRIYLNVTGTDGATWGTPFAHPASLSSVSVDDISAVIAFGPGKMGVMWSRQVGDSTDGMYWSHHVDGAPDTDWTAPVAAVSGQRSGDDHMNLKWLDSSGGRVFAAVKTSNIAASQPLIQLLALNGTTWTAHTIATVSECPNRVMLLIDESTQMLRTFATYPKPGGTTNAGVCSNSGGAIYEKSVPLNNINFSAATKTPRILDADQYAHNVTSTKQNLNSSARGTANSGLLVLADVDDTSRYWHYYDGSAGDTTAPTVTGKSPSAGAPGVAVSADVTGTFSEAMNSSTITSGTFTLTPTTPGSTAVPAAVTYDGTGNIATLNPSADLAAGTAYTATIEAGTTGVKDLAGNALAADITWTFTTAYPAPVASFTATPASGTAPLEVSFTDTSAGSPTSWSWDFGDGGTSTVQSPVHTYTADGTYTATLTATNGTGSNTSSSTITVSPALPPDAPVASFTATPASGTAPLEVSFTDTSAGSPTSWSWDFGDGGTSTVQSPVHTYTADGTYNVTLTATNGTGSNTSSSTITVSPALPPDAPTLDAPRVVNLANVAAASVSGTAGAANTVSVTASDGAGHAVSGTVTASSTGAWALPTLNLASLNDGTVTLTATAADAAGNVSPTTTVTVAKDTVPPAVVTLTVPATVTGATVTSVTVSGSAEAGATVTLRVTDGDAVHTVTATTAADAAGNWSTTANLTSLSDGQLTYTATATDAAVNTGASATQTGTKKTTATAPQFTGLPSSITGDTVGAVPLTGTADPGATVALTAIDSANHSVSATVAANGSGNWSATFNLSTFNSGSTTFSAQATDVSGNVSTVTTGTSRIGPKVISVTLENGGTAGTADTNDRVVVVFNEAMSPGSFCNTWTSPAGPWTQKGNSVSVLISRNTSAPNDTLTLSTGCTTNNFGTVNLGARYTTSTGGNLTFKSTGSRPPSSVSLSTDGKTLTITLGVLKGGTPATGVPAGIPTYQGTANGQSGIATDTNGVPLGTKPSGSGTASGL